MRPTVTFHKLWLVSERDESAKQVAFSPSKNLLAGGNETGKSRVLKHLVWALGCNPRAQTAGGWDSNVVAAVELSIGKKRYTFLRTGRDNIAAFDSAGKLLFATESAPKWAAFFAETFDYPLKLQRHAEGKFGLAGPEYAVLPFYIDQEGGWGVKWTNFTRLTQFSRWEPLVLEAFTGLRPQRYFLAQLQRDEVVTKLRESRLQQKVQARAYEQVAAMLPKSDTKLDEASFAKELKDVSEKAAALAKEEDEMRSALFEAAQLRQEKAAELQMVSRAEHDLVADLAYLSKYPDEGQLTCPTCGQAHGTSFRARVELASDAKDAHELVLNIRQQLDKVREREHVLRGKLTKVTASLETLRSAMARPVDGRPVADIIAAQSRTTLEHAYDQSRRDLVAQIDELDEEQKELQEELDGLTDKGREKRLRAEYKQELNSFADRLNIAKAEIGTRISIAARPPMGSGSSGPRIYLAMHMALLTMNKKYGEGPLLPFIIDTPRQQDIDDENMSKLLNTIFTHSPSHQIFVANGSVPQGWTAPQDCSVLRFDNKRQLLRTEEYKDGVAALAPLVEQMRQAIEAERVAAAAQGESQDSEVLTSDEGHADEEDEDDGAVDDES
jgi:hypothetical protein